VGMPAFSFSECPPAAGDLIGHDAHRLAVDDRAAFELPAELSKLVALGPLAAMGQPDRGPTRQAESAWQRALHQPGEDAGL